MGVVWGPGVGVLGGVKAKFLSSKLKKIPIPICDYFISSQKIAGKTAKIDLVGGGRGAAGVVGEECCGCGVHSTLDLRV